MWVRGHWRSLKLVPFESLGTVSYSSSIVTMAISAAILEIFSVKNGLTLKSGFGVLHIIKSRSNLSCLLLTFRQHLLPLSKWLPVPIFSRKMPLLRRKERRRDVTRYMSPHLCSLCVLEYPACEFRSILWSILLSGYLLCPRCWLHPILWHDVIFLYHMICYSGFVLLFIDRLLPLLCKLCFVL